MSSLVIESASIEPIDVTIRTVADPTGTPPSFQVTISGASTPVGTWINGAWVGAWNATTTNISAVTPTIGAAGAAIVTVEGSYSLWIKWGSVIKRVNSLIVT